MAKLENSYEYLWFLFFENPKSNDSFLRDHLLLRLTAMRSSIAGILAISAWPVINFRRCRTSLIVEIGWLLFNARMWRMRVSTLPYCFSTAKKYVSKKIKIISSLFTKSWWRCRRAGLVARWIRWCWIRCRRHIFNFFTHFIFLALSGKFWGVFRCLGLQHLKTKRLL